METEAEQASKILDKYINKLKTIMIYKDNSFVDMLKEAESFLIKWDLTDKKIAIYELSGDYFCMKNELNKSIVYYEKALAVVGKLFPTEELLNLLHKLCRTYGNAGRYDESISCCDFVLNHFQNLSEKDTVYFVYNRAFTFMNLRNFERALADIDKIEAMIDKDHTRRYFKVLDTKAVCLCEIHHYEEALELYNKLLDVVDDSDIDKKMVVYINIIEAYLAQAEKDKAIDVFSTVKDKIHFITNGSKFEADIYFEIGNIYKDLNNVTESKRYYKKALDTAKKQKKCVLIKSILCKLMDNMYGVENVENIKSEIFEISIKQEKLTDELIHKLMSFYIANKDISKLAEINNFTLRFI